MARQLLLVSALALAACSKNSPATETAGPVQCAPGTTLVDGRCVASEPVETDPKIASATEPAKKDVVGEFQALSDEMCACKDRACAEAVNKKFEGWLEENENASGSLEEQERAEQIAKSYTECMMTAMGGSPEPTPVDPSTVSEDKKKLAAEVVAMFDAVAAVVKKHSKDCAKMAAGVQRVADKNRGLIEQGKNMDDDAAFRQWFDETYGEKLKATMTEAMTAMMEKCAEDEGVRKAFQSLTGE